MAVNPYFNNKNYKPTQNLFEDLSDEVNTEGNTEENRANKRLHFFVRVIWVAILFAVVIGAMSYL